MFSLDYKLPKTMSNFCPSKLPRKKVSRNDVDFSTIEITSKKVRRNNVDFSTSEITSKKVRRNEVDFSISEITSKNPVEMTGNSSKFGLRRIDVISTSNRRRFDVIRPLGSN